MSDIEKVKKLREATGAGFKDCNLAIKESAGDLDTARAAVDANPNDLQARQDLAMALFAMGDNAGAMAQLLESIRIDRGWNEDAARLQPEHTPRHVRA